MTIINALPVDYCILANSYIKPTKVGVRLFDEQTAFRGSHMKIGVTSQNFRTITGHAGRARRFFVYQAKDGDVAEVERLDLPKEMAMHGYQGAEHPIDQLDVLITAGCGDGFRRKMAARGIHVVSTSETDPQQAARKVAANLPVKPIKSSCGG